MNHWKLTEQERRALNYHPVLEYIPKDITSPERSIEDVVGGEVSPLLLNIATNVWQDIERLCGDLESLIKNIEDRYSNATDGVAKVTEEDINYLRELYIPVSGYSLPSLNNGISFNIYKEAMDNAPEPYREVLMELYELYHMDVNGVIEVEIYRDLREILDDWYGVKDFFRKGAITQVDSNLSPSEKLDELVVKENRDLASLITMKVKLDKLREQIEDTYAGRIDTNLGELIPQFNTLEDQLNKLQDKITLKAELTNVTKERVYLGNYLYRNIQNIAYLELRDTFPSVEGVISEILNNFNSDEIVALLGVTRTKLDEEINTLREIDHKRRSIIGPDTKAKINNDLLCGTHLMSNVSQVLVRKMRNVSEDTPNADGLLDLVATSINTTNDKYRTHLEDYYQIEETDYSMRVTRLDNVRKKFNTRNYYRLLSVIYRCMRDLGRKPTASEVIDNWG
jgi:hypothetical protein